MGARFKPLLLNLGAGFNPLPDHVSVDNWGNPDVKWDLNVTPYPWDDNSVDGIEMWHTLEHLPNWWEAFKECARILKPGGYLNIRVPDESSRTALTYRDHVAVFGLASFHGTIESDHGTNAWAETESGSVPLKLVNYYQVPYREYDWMRRWCPWLLKFCANHLRNFIHEQRFYFRKV
jgi:SAM-dependent methyltransferase